MTNDIDSYLLKCALEALDEGFEPEEVNVECACRLGLEKPLKQQIEEE